jgi:hypothetical protein
LAYVRELLDSRSSNEPLQNVLAKEKAGEDEARRIFGVIAGV